ncbi:hydantoinase/oxoprolinase family protein [Streptomyces sp. SID8352]|uniref:hydantoinase/oxoprolinase family protein n=1 Tax=Streptomyces sp. SID8352 TaxID=2690338 RepID=UPI0013699550|nr:hydantoinase/oxoprolinase family protein [Streptomyces sp. SID8352]MYU22636.1 hydantoinase/oxoprolinase family protein [Streptomyces sp. SID8352]
MTHSGQLRVGVDIGGTFTDMAIMDDTGIVAVGKTLTTHAEPAAGVERLLGETLVANALPVDAVSTVVHGTTLVTNALIERRGARTALLTTEGFRDVVEMAREHRYELYDLNLDLPRPLVPRYLRFGIPERTLATGAVERPLDEAVVRRLATELRSVGIEAVGVCLLHSHVNPAHEQRVADIFRDVAPTVRVALSSEVNPEIREYERATTTLANVYVQDLVETYLADLRSRLRRMGIARDPLIMLSNGGVATVDVAARFPIRMLESGPAGGALGAVAFGRVAGRPHQMAFDMGGTTAKLCVIENHRPLVTHTFEVDRMYRMLAGSGLPVRAPVIDMIEIGTGGGSIARISSLGLVTVGPDSAGSEPGPVAFGRGGTGCTVTDADFVLGYLDPASFSGGDLVLDVPAAAAAIDEQIAGPLGLSVPEAAWGIHTTANEAMASAARVHAIERGQDPARLPLFVSGGNGPLHGPGVARALGAPRLVSPPAAGVLSTLGFLSAPMSIDIVRSRHYPLAGITLADVVTLYEEMASEGVRILEESGIPRGDIVCERTLEMRFIGQGNELEVPAPAADENWHNAVATNFTRLYLQRFGTAVPRGVAPEIISWRAVVRGPGPDATLRLTGAGRTGEALKGHRRAYFPAAGGYVATPVYSRYHLQAGTVLTGPALIEERESTLVVGPGDRCTVAEDTSIVVEFDREQFQ